MRRAYLHLSEYRETKARLLAAFVIEADAQTAMEKIRRRFWLRLKRRNLQMIITRDELEKYHYGRVRLFGKRICGCGRKRLIIK